MTGFRRYFRIQKALIDGYFPPARDLITFISAVLALVVGALVWACRRRGRGSSGRVRARKDPGRMSPMPMGPASTSSAYGMGAPVEPHTYEPVSMALTDDTFVPPSPAFQKEGTKLRPMSVA